MGGGRRDQATRGARRRAAGARGRPAVGAMRAQRSRGDLGLGEDDGGPGCKKQKIQGPHCNVLVTFQLVLKWRWAQKQKCVVFQNAQLCFKVHPQKSNSFEINMKLS
jgi:hypothetical protein